MFLKDSLIYCLNTHTLHSFKIDYKSGCFQCINTTVEVLLKAKITEDIKYS